MRTLKLAAGSAGLVIALAALAGCSKEGVYGANPAIGGLRLGPKDGAWSARQGLEGPLAIWGPAEVGKEVLSITCLPRPRRQFTVTLFPPASKTGKLQPGELMVRADGKGVGVPLTLKEDGSAEAHLPASDSTLAAWNRAKSLRFEFRAVPGDGVDTGPASAALNQVITACR